MMRIRIFSLLLCILLFIPILSDKTFAANASTGTPGVGSDELISENPAFSNAQALEDNRLPDPNRDQPTIEVQPNAIELELFTGDIEEVPITIGNTGDEVLAFTAGANVIGEPDRGPRRDEPGDVLAEYDGGLATIGGMTSTLDGRIWACSYSGNEIRSMDVENGEVLSQWAGPGSPLSIVWQGEELWVASWSGVVITRYNLDGEALGTFNMEFNQICGMGTDLDGHVFMNSKSDNVVHVINIEDHQQIATIDYRASAGNADIWGIEWVQDHPNGQLWCNTSRMMYQVSVNDDWECEAVQNFQTVGDQPYVGPGHDGENIWHGMWGNNTWYKLDDGVAEVRWIAIDQEAGEIGPDEELDIFAIFDATGLVGGDYSAEITINSNDPDNGEVVVDVALMVEGAPDIFVEWDEDAGFPDLLDFNMFHPELFIDGVYAIPVAISNIGTDPLTIEDVVSNSDNFTTPFEEAFEIPVGETIETAIIFTSAEVGEYEGTITIFCDDPDEGELAYNMVAISSSPPAIFVEPNAIESTLITGEMEEFVINIANEGEAVLNGTIDIEVFDNDDRDNTNQRNVRRTSGLVGPRRDPLDEGMIDGMMFCIFQTNSNWGWMDDGMRQDPLLNGDNFVSYRGANDPAEVDYEEYDAMVFNLYNQQFMGAYNANMERLTEYVDGGGGLYFETGNTQGHRSPGGITNDSNGGTSNGTLVVSPDPNHDDYSYLAEVFNASEPDFWQIGEVIEGSSWLHSKYTHGQFENGVENGTLEWFQPIASLQNQPDQWGAVAYGIGGGTVLTVGHPTGHCWFNYARDGGQWGSMASEILYYLATAGSPNWLTIDIAEFDLEQGADLDIGVLLDATGLYGGVYEADVVFWSNDPENPEVRVNVLLDVTGVPVLEAEWGPGYPDVVDWNVQYEDLFSGGPYNVPVELMNVGTDLLIIDDVISDHEYFMPEFEDVIEVEAGESVFVN
ncbi:MAG: hypothetical protein HN590_16485, partial [Calditrichaeota bacterium]|nr:hypothetical protein [Calditrichota bacterium]